MGTIINKEWLAMAEKEEVKYVVKGDAKQALIELLQNNDSVNLHLLVKPQDDGSGKEVNVFYIEANTEGASTKALSTDALDIEVLDYPPCPWDC